MGSRASSQGLAVVMTGWWAASVAKRGIGGTLRLVSIYALLAALVAVACWGVFSGKFYAWRANVWKERAEQAAAEAIIAQRQAATAETSQAIANDTQQAMDNVRVEVVLPAEQSAQRIEAKADEQESAGHEPASDVDSDILREVDEAEAGYSAAADRLRRKGTR